MKLPKHYGPQDAPLKKAHLVPEMYEKSVWFLGEDGKSVAELAQEYGILTVTKLRRALEAERQHRFLSGEAVTAPGVNEDGAKWGAFSGQMRDLASQALDLYLETLAKNRISLSRLWPVLELMILEENRRRCAEGSGKFSRWVERKRAEYMQGGKSLDTFRDELRFAVADLQLRSADRELEEIVGSREPLLALPRLLLEVGPEDDLEEPQPPQPVVPLVEGKAIDPFLPQPLDEVLKRAKGGLSLPVGALMVDLPVVQEKPLPLQDRTHGGPVSDEEFEEIYGVPSPRRTVREGVSDE